MDNYGNAFPGKSELFDAEPLRLSSGHGGGAIDVLNFLFEADLGPDGSSQDDGGERGVLADSNASAELEKLLASSGGLSATMSMDLQVDSLSGSLNDDSAPRSSTSSFAYQPSRRSQRGEQAHRLHHSFQMGVVDFDPPAKPWQQPQRRHSVDFQAPAMPRQQSQRRYSADYSQSQSAMPWQQPQQQHFEPAHHHTGHSDLFLCSHSTAQSYSSIQPISRHVSNGRVANEALQQQQQDHRHFSQPQYVQALQRLTDCIERSQESRTWVMAQRTTLTPAQQQALSTSMQQFQRQNGQVQQQQRQQQQQDAPQANLNTQGDSSMSPSTASSSVMATFISGTRGGLTNSLQHSQR